MRKDLEVMYQSKITSRGSWIKLGKLRYPLLRSNPEETGVRLYIEMPGKLLQITQQISEITSLLIQGFYNLYKTSRLMGFNKIISIIRQSNHLGALHQMPNEAVIYSKTSRNSKGMRG